MNKQEIFESILPYIHKLSQTSLRYNNFYFEPTYHDKEDMVQELSIFVWTKIDSYDENEGLDMETYLKVHCHYKKRNLIKKMARVRQHESFTDKQYHSTHDDVYEWEDEHIDEFVHEAIEKHLHLLSKRQREVFVLCYLQDRSEREIGKELGISRISVREHKQEAVKKMKKVLAQYLQE